MSRRNAEHSIADTSVTPSIARHKLTAADQQNVQFTPATLPDIKKYTTNFVGSSMTDNFKPDLESLPAPTSSSSSHVYMATTQQSMPMGGDDFSNKPSYPTNKSLPQENKQKELITGNTTDKNIATNESSASFRGSQYTSTGKHT